MKKYIVILFLLCASLAQASSTVVVVGQPTAAPAGGCPSGTYLFAWNGDHASGGTYACDSVGTARNASATNGGTIDAAYGQSGNGFRVTAADQYMEWADNFSLASLVTGSGTATIWMSVYIVSPGTPDPNIFELYNDDSSYTTDYVETQINNGTLPSGGFSGNSTVDTTSWSGTEISGSTWTRVGLTWDMNQAGADFCVVVGAGSWECDDDDMVDFSATAAMKFVIGERRFGTANPDQEMYIDNVYIISGYQQSDPL